jgi:hypothetical protein
MLTRRREKCVLIELTDAVGWMNAQGANRRSDDTELCRASGMFTGLIARRAGVHVAANHGQRKNRSRGIPYPAFRLEKAALLSERGPRTCLGADSL